MSPSSLRTGDFVSLITTKFTQTVRVHDFSEYIQLLLERLLVQFIYQFLRLHAGYLFLLHLFGGRREAEWEGQLHIQTDQRECSWQFVSRLMAFLPPGRQRTFEHLELYNFIFSSPFNHALNSFRLLVFN